jgi:SAM-dependent methyltransferase
MAEPRHGLEYAGFLFYRALMGATESGELYHPRLIGILQSLWGDGWLSPGGPEEVARLVEGIDFSGRSVLDIGCGAGGVDLFLVERLRSGYVCGIDVEDTVLNEARARVERAGFAQRIGFAKVAPGPLPFPEASFDIVFSKDAIVHIPDKRALMADACRVLKPGGWFVASDWLIGHDGEPSPAFKTYLASEELDFGMASPARYRAAMAEAGLVDISIDSRNAWYRERARTELDLLTGPLYREAAENFGQDFVDRNIAIWRNMLPVLDSGEHCPTHLRGHKP